MKLAIFALVTSFSVFAAAADSGLNCTMEYKQSGALSSYTLSDSRWLVEGSEMEGPAMITDGDGIAGTSAANYLEINKTVIDGEPFWTVKVLGGEKNVAGVFSFPLFDGMKATLPANAVANEEEDPAQFDTLNVTCYFTIFAG